MPDSPKKYKVKANGFSFSFDESDIVAVDLVKRPDNSFNLLRDHQSLNVKIAAAATNSKKLTIEVEGESFEIEIRDELDQKLEQMGFGMAVNKQIKEVRAPMPGMVLEIAVTDGQEVLEGDKILILGAMKMENSIMIHANARIKKVIVKAGQAVDKGQVLVELE